MTWSPNNELNGRNEFSELRATLCAIFFFGMETANDGDGLRIVIEVLAVFMPIGMMWVGATAARSARIMRPSLSGDRVSVRS